jgi:nucleoside-diphosphate-sugar epimerase
MKILIVGGTSSLALTLAPLLSGYHEVVTAGRKNCDIYLDLANAEESLALPDDIDVFIHTAAHFGGKGDHEILEAENINVLGTLKLCQAASKAKAKHFIFISTIFTAMEKSSPHFTIYALSKKHAEEMADFLLYNTFNSVDYFKAFTIIWQRRSIQETPAFFLQYN